MAAHHVHAVPGRPEEGQVVRYHMGAGGPMFSGRATSALSYRAVFQTLSMYFLVVRTHCAAHVGWGVLCSTIPRSSHSWAPESRVTEHRAWTEWDLTLGNSQWRKETVPPGPSFFELWAGLSWFLHPICIDYYFVPGVHPSIVKIRPGASAHSTEDRLCLRPLNLLLPSPSHSCSNTSIESLSSLFCLSRLNSNIILCKPVLTSHFNVTPSHIPFPISWFILLLPEVTI